MLILWLKIMYILIALSILKDGLRWFPWPRLILMVALLWPLLFLWEFLTYRSK